MTLENALGEAQHPLVSAGNVATQCLVRTKNAMMEILMMEMGAIKTVWLKVQRLELRKLLHGMMFILCLIKI